MQAMFIKPSANFNGLLCQRLLVSQLIMTPSTDAGKVRLQTRHNTFCILSPLIPKFRVRKDKKNLSKISLHISKFAIIESSINTNFALLDDVDMVTFFLKVSSQLNLPFLANVLISGFIFNGYLTHAPNNKHSKFKEC